MRPMLIRETGAEDRAAILAVETAAFATDPSVPALVGDLLDDPSARPLLSLLATGGDNPIGHILFTAAQLDPPATISTAILAPLAVIPERQNQGLGGALIRDGLERLCQIGIDLVFVLGHIDYYPRHGFRPAAPFGLMAPYPIPEEVADAWMVAELTPGTLGKVSGTVRCAETMDRPQYWQE